MTQNTTEYKLQKILEKCMDDETRMSRCLSESRISNLIVEALSEADVSELQDALKKSRSALDDVKEWISKLGIEIPAVIVYTESIEQALNKAQAELARINFGADNPVAGVWDGKVTLPGIIQAVAALYAKIVDFTNGFKSMIQNVQENIGSLVSDIDKDKALIDLAGEGSVPDLDVLTKGFQTAAKESFKTGFLNKLSGFFGGSGKKFGSIQKKIVDMVPELGQGIIDDMVSQLLNVPLNQLLNEIPPPDKDPQDEIAGAARDAEEQATSDEAEGVPMETSNDKGTESGSEEAPAASPKEQVASVKTSVQAAAKEAVSPLDAALDALKTWSTSLPTSSQKMLKMKNRMGELEDGIKTGLKNSQSAIEREVESAIETWIDAHGETLVKSRKFSNKSLDSLLDMIPRLATHMLQKTDESGGRLTKNNVHKFTHHYLNKKFRNELRSNILFEVLISPVGTKRDIIVEEDETMARWKELAGIN